MRERKSSRIQFSRVDAGVASFTVPGHLEPTPSDRARSRFKREGKSGLRYKLALLPRVFPYPINGLMCFGWTDKFDHEVYLSILKIFSGIQFNDSVLHEDTISICVSVTGGLLLLKENLFSNLLRMTYSIIEMNFPKLDTKIYM